MFSHYGFSISITISPTNGTTIFILNFIFIPLFMRWNLKGGFSVWRDLDVAWQK